MKGIVTALCLVLALLSGTHPLLNGDAEPPPPAYHADAEPLPAYHADEIWEHSENKVFYIRALHDDYSLKATGTGVIISADGMAATAYHVIVGAERIEAIFNDGRSVEQIEVLGYDELTDAAILKLPAPGPGRDFAQGYAPDPASGTPVLYNAISIREGAVKQGEQVFAIGYPLKGTAIITEGIINSPGAEINGRDRILTSAQIVSGMSGGPLIDRYGRLVGIISGSMRTMDNIHLVIAVEDLQSLLPAD